MLRTAEIQENLLRIAGILLIALIAIFLLAPTDVSQNTLADITFWGRTNTSVFIQTAFDYNNKSNIEKFPIQLGDWKGYDFKYSERIYERLDADILLSRAYWRKGDVIWIDIINSKTSKSFHDPRICYSYDWNLTNESVEALHILGNKSYFSYTTIYVNKIEVKNKQNLNQSQVVLFWFMFKPFSRDYGITMIRLSAPVKNIPAETYAYMKEFVEKELFDAMYEKVAIETRTYGEEIISTHGGWGILAIGIVFLIPTTLLFPGILKLIIRILMEKFK